MPQWPDMIDDVRHLLQESPDLIKTPSGESLRQGGSFPSLTFIIWNGAVWVGNGADGQLHEDLAYYISECWKLHGTTNPKGRKGFKGTYTELKPPASMDSSDVRYIRDFNEGARPPVGWVAGRARKDSQGVWYISFWESQRSVVPEAKSGVELVAKYLGGKVMAELWNTSDRERTGLSKASYPSTVYPMAVSLEAYLRGNLSAGGDAEHRTMRPE